MRELVGRLLVGKSEGLPALDEGADPVGQPCVAGQRIAAAAGHHAAGLQPLQIGQFAICEALAHRPVDQLRTLGAGHAQILEVERDGQKKAVILREKAQSLFHRIVKSLIGGQGRARDLRPCTFEDVQDFGIFLEPEHIVAGTPPDCEACEKRAEARLLRRQSGRQGELDDIGHGPSPVSCIRQALNPAPIGFSFSGARREERRAVTAREVPANWRRTRGEKAGCIAGEGLVSEGCRS